MELSQKGSRLRKYVTVFENVVVFENKQSRWGMCKLDLSNYWSIRLPA